ncbi:MAG: hypothetical protein M1833_003064 [Piccolia ochrophora]|nr:MAG: hypothetical protein M1833_003064 [Piccolia ochrophora]
MAHKCGVPYKIPRAHTIHGHSDLAQRSVDSLPATSTVDTGPISSQIKDSIISAQQDVRLVRSEHGSPHAGATSHIEHMKGDLSPLDISLSEFASTSRPQLDMNVTSNPHDPYFSPTSDIDAPIFSAGLDPPSVDWTALDLDSNALVSPTYGQPSSYNGYDYGHFGHAHAASVATSEPDDFAPLGNPSPVRPPSLVHNQLPSDSSEACESDNYRLSTASSFHGLPQLSLLSSNNLEDIDIDEFLNGAAAGTSFSGRDGGTETGNTAMGLAGFSINEGRKGGPTSVPSDDISYSIPATAESTDSLWMSHFDTATAHVPESDVADSVWTN